MQASHPSPTPWKPALHPTQQSQSSRCERDTSSKSFFLFSSLEALAPAGSHGSLLCPIKFLLWTPFCFLKLFPSLTLTSP